MDDPVARHREVQVPCPGQVGGLVGHQMGVLRGNELEQMAFASRCQRRGGHRGAVLVPHAGKCVQVHRARQHREVQFLRCRGVRQRLRFGGDPSGGDDLHVARDIGSPGEQQGQFVVEAGLGRILQHRQAVSLGKQPRKERGKGTMGRLDRGVPKRQGEGHRCVAAGQVAVQVAEADAPVAVRVSSPTCTPFLCTSTRPMNLSRWRSGVIDRRRA